MISIFSIFKKTQKLPKDYILFLNKNKYYKDKFDVIYGDNKLYSYKDQTFHFKKYLASDEIVISSWKVECKVSKQSYVLDILNDKGNVFRHLINNNNRIQIADTFKQYFKNIQIIRSDINSYLKGRNNRVIENKFNITLPRDYSEFVNKKGFIEEPGLVIFGYTAKIRNSHLDVIEMTLYERCYIPLKPHEIVISRNDFETTILNCKNGLVYEYKDTGTIGKIYKNFNMFLKSKGIKYV